MSREIKLKRKTELGQKGGKGRVAAFRSFRRQLVRERATRGLDTGIGGGGGISATNETNLKRRGTLCFQP